MALSVEQGRRRAPRQSERTRLDPFVVIGGGRQPARPARSDGAGHSSRCRNPPRTKPILFRAIDVEVAGVRDARAWHGDDLGRRRADLGRSQIVRPRIRALPLRAFFRLTPYQLLRGSAGPTANQQYLLLKAALAGCNRRLSLPPSANGEHGGGGNSPGSRMGGNVDAGRPRRGHGIRAARLVLQQRDRPLVVLTSIRLPPADGRHRALAPPGWRASTPGVSGMGWRVRVRASPRQVR